MEWALVGRAAELSRLTAVLTGPRCGVVLAGPAGVGKTRLAQECARRAAGPGRPVVTFTAVPGAEAGRLGAVATEAVTAASGSGIVLVVDDAHLLDEASAATIHHLVARGAAVVVTAVVAGAAAPEPVVALWKDGLAERVDLAPLGEDAFTELIATAVGGPVDEAAVAVFAHLCQGNLVFLRELLLGAVDDGALRDDGGLWRLVAPAPVTPALAQLIDRRMGPLSPAERELLEAVAVAEPLGPGELRALGDPRLVEDLARRGLLASTLSGRRIEVSSGEPLFGRRLRGQIPPLVAARIARSLVEATEETGGRRREDTLRIARWSFEAGLPRPRLMLAAARAARWRYDFPLAERLARAASDDGAGFEAEVLAAQLACLRGRTAEAAQRLADLAEEAADDAQRAIVAVGLIDVLGVYKGWMDEGLRLAEQVEQGISDQVWRDEITARRAIILHAMEGPAAAVRLSEPLLGRATGRGLVWACMGLAFALGRLGRIAEALQLTERGHAEHLVLTQPIDRYPWIHSWLRCEALAHAGRLHEAEALARAQYRQGIQDASSEAQAYFSWHLATVVGDRGHVQEAIRSAREGVALNRDLGRPHYVGECLIGLTTALALAGEATAAAEALQALEALDLPDAMFKPAERDLARAWVAVAAGDLEHGDDLFAAAADTARQRGDRVGEAAALHCRARIGGAAAVVGRLAGVAAGIEGELAPARAAHARALADGDAEACLDLSARFEAMGADLLAGEAAADASVILRRRGEARRATGAGRRAEKLRERCEGAVTPSLQAVGIRSSLTRAEYRTAMLAAAGRSNREIALALCLSVRTVENHLAHVYDKLGVTGRAELADAMEAAVDPDTATGS